MDAQQPHVRNSQVSGSTNGNAMLPVREVGEQARLSVMVGALRTPGQIGDALAGALNTALAIAAGTRRSPTRRVP